MLAAADEHYNDCPECGNTDIRKDEELYRPWVLVLDCNTCGHQWKLAN